MIIPGTIYRMARAQVRVIETLDSDNVIAEVRGRLLFTTIRPEHEVIGCEDVTALELIECAFWKAEQTATAHNFEHAGRLPARGGL